MTNEEFYEAYEKGRSAGKLEAIEFISNEMGWEESRDEYAEKLGFARIYPIKINKNGKTNLA